MSRPIFTLLCAALLAVLIACASIAWGAEPETERTHCDDEGGCVYVTMQDLRAALARAFRAGQAKGETACFRGTS